MSVSVATIAKSAIYTCRGRWQADLLLLRVPELANLRMAEERVVIEAHLGVQGHEPALPRHDKKLLVKVQRAAIACPRPNAARRWRATRRRRP